MAWSDVRSEILRSIGAALERDEAADEEKLDEIFGIVAAYRAARLKEPIRNRVGATVQGGPFRGMHFLDRVAEGAHIPKLLGAYEAELHPLIERLASAGYDAVVNVGCAEGYYAVGFALRCPGAVVHAFDIDARAQALCRELARLNGVADRVAVAGECTPATLEAAARGRMLVLCDIEGAEAALLDPNAAPALRRADVLAELHTVSGRWTSEVLYPRFAASHAVTEFHLQARNAADYPALGELPPADQFFALLERVEPTRWAFFEAKRR